MMLGIAVQPELSEDDMQPFSRRKLIRAVPCTVAGMALGNLSRHVAAQDPTCPHGVCGPGNLPNPTIMEGWLASMQLVSADAHGSGATASDLASASTATSMLNSELSRVGVNSQLDTLISSSKAQILTTNPASVDPMSLYNLVHTFVPTITISDVSAVLAEPTTPAMVQQFVSQPIATTFSQTVNTFSILSRDAISGGPIRAISLGRRQFRKPHLEESACGWAIAAGLLGIAAIIVGAATADPVLIYLGGAELRGSALLGIIAADEGIVGGVFC